VRPRGHRIKDTQKEQNPSQKLANSNTLSR
jgi:hypothetical protein